MIGLVTRRVLRRARVGDAAAIASAHIASRDDAYAPLAAEWSADDTSARTKMWAKTLSDAKLLLVIVAEDANGAVIGFVEGGPARRQEPAAELEIYVIHVHPKHRGQGLGDALWVAACEELRGPKLASMYVDTLAELRSCSFYARHGGQVVERRVTDLHGAARTHVTYRWADGVSSGSK
jgi:ribosomal protein S18 acetylase RimI-like enzyme